MLCLFWSVPVLAFGWVLVGLPAVALGDRVLTISVWLLAAAGAATGVFIIFLFPLLNVASEMLHPKPGLTSQLALSESNMLGWLLFFAGLGAAGMMTYRWRLEGEIASQQAKKNSLKPTAVQPEE